MTGQTNEKNYVLITGATVGIGYEMAKVFAKEGYPLILVARQQDRLKEVQAELHQQYGIDVEYFAVDLSGESAAKGLYEDIQARHLPVEILVNNAGFGLIGKFVELNLETQLKMIRLNISSLTILSHLFLKNMLQRNRGKILNIASTASFQPGPLMAVYYATKAYVLFFSEALYYELKGTNITVTTLCPGPTLTDFQRRAGLKDHRVVRLGLMEASKVADAAYRGLMKGKRLVIPGAMNKMGVLTAKFFPRSWIMQTIKFLNQ